jgi:hypothetical protein
VKERLRSANADCTMDCAYCCRRTDSSSRALDPSRCALGANWVWTALKFGPLELGELKREIASVRSDVDDLNDRVYKLFLLTMSPDMFNN